MSSYKTINNITGWIIFIIALVVYTLTLEATVSFWDCGEFTLGARYLEVVHPPGAPMFLLIARFFTMFAPDDSWVPWLVNFQSGLVSAFSVLFLFWITTAFAKKIIIKDVVATTHQTFTVMAAGVVAALACTFSDTIWFSAVEGEVYAMSLFFMMFVFWVIMKWEAEENEAYRDKWLILVAFLVGISVGVHLMSLLAIPAMCLVYYFKKYENPTPIGVIGTLIVGFFILGLVFKGLISYLTGVVASVELLFVNSFGLPFNSGIVFFYAMLMLALVLGVYFASINRHKVWVVEPFSIRFGTLTGRTVHIMFLSLIMVMLGFSSYTMVVIRANVGTPINMNTPSDIFRFESYLNREQYGSRPLLRGPHFNAYPNEIKKASPRYFKGDDKYIQIGHRVEYEFAAKDMMWFPRMGSWQDPRHSGSYNNILGLKKGEDPNMADNIQFFLRYQVGFMYWRYFMWNFSGRQNDLQGRYDQKNNQGKWITGIPFIDEIRIGPQDHAPNGLADNDAHNEYYMIPFILGLLGIFFHYNRDPKSFIIVAALFLFSGVFQVIYLNSPPFEPRERDYTLVGSFVTFCLWIGFGMLAIYEMLKKAMKNNEVSLAMAVVIALLAPVLMAANNWDDHDRSERYVALDFATNYLESVETNAVIFTQGDNDTYPLWYAQEVEHVRPDVRVVNLSLLGVDWYIEQLTRAINEAPPLNLTLTPDKYLGNRRDVTPYYPKSGIDQDVPLELKTVVEYIANESPKAKVRRKNGDETNHLPTKNVKLTVNRQQVIENNIVPANMESRIVDEMVWKVNKDNLVKNDLITLDLVASNLWERPIYFAVSVSPDSYLGMGNYFQLEGLAYRVVPIRSASGGSGTAGYVDVQRMYENVIGEFNYGGIEKKKTITYTVKEGEDLAKVSYEFNYTEEEFKKMAGVSGPLSAGQQVKVVVPDENIYLDENTLRMTMNLRSNFARLAEAFINQGNEEKAAEVLNVCLEKMPEELVPYNVFMLNFPEIYYRAGKTDKARLLLRKMMDHYKLTFRYNYELVEAGFDSPIIQRERDQAGAVMQRLIAIASENDTQEFTNQMMNDLQQLQNQMSPGGL